jgi:hypothetical protein
MSSSVSGGDTDHSIQNESFHYSEASSSKLFLLQLHPELTAPCRANIFQLLPDTSKTACLDSKVSRKLSSVHPCIGTVLHEERKKIMSHITGAPTAMPPSRLISPSRRRGTRTRQGAAAATGWRRHTPTREAPPSTARDCNLHSRHFFICDSRKTKQLAAQLAEGLRDCMCPCDLAAKCGLGNFLNKDKNSCGSRMLTVHV